MFSLKFATLLLLRIYYNLIAMVQAQRLTLYTYKVSQQSCCDFQNYSFLHCFTYMCFPISYFQRISPLYLIGKCQMFLMENLQDLTRRLMGNVYVALFLRHDCWDARHVQVSSIERQAGQPRRDFRKDAYPTETMENDSLERSA